MNTNPDQIRLNGGQPTAELLAHLDRYRPRKKIRPEVLEFCVGQIVQLAFASLESAQKSLTVLTGFAQWCWLVGIELIPEAVFDPSNIRRWVLTEGAEWRGERRWRVAHRMLNIGNLINGTSLAVDIPDRDSEADPYFSADIPWIFSWAGKQGTPRLRIAANAVVAFCGGAGLTNREVAELHVGDVEANGDTVTIRLTGDRVVPVDPRWAGPAQFVLESVDHDEGFLLSPNWLTNRSQLIRPRYGEGTRWPRPHRLRNTWIVGMLHRLPLPTVMHLSGVATIQGLLRHEKFLRPDYAAEFTGIYTGTPMP